MCVTGGGCVKRSGLLLQDKTCVKIFQDPDGEDDKDDDDLPELE